MAYVMNPYNYKLGYSLSWSDDGFSNKKLYPVILQIMLTIRYFLLFFGTRRKIEKLDTYLSHIHLMLHSGRLLITLFFYEAKMNKARNYKYNILATVMRSIPFSYSNSTYKFFDQEAEYRSIPERVEIISPSNTYFFVTHSLEETKESQRFFLFFSFLGLDPSSFLLELYARFGKKRRKKVTRNGRNMIEKKRYTPSNRDTILITELELIILSKIYTFLNEKVFFFGLYDKEKNLNMIRFLRALFFSGGMALFPDRFVNFTAKNYESSEFALDFLRGKKIEKDEKKKKKLYYKNFKLNLEKLRFFAYCKLLNINWAFFNKINKKRLSDNYLSDAVKFILLSLKVNYPVRVTSSSANKPLKDQRKGFSMGKKRQFKIKKVESFIKKKKNKIKDLTSSNYVANFYEQLKIGSTKLDVGGGVSLNDGIEEFYPLMKLVGGFVNHRGKKLDLSFYKQFHFYRLFFNYFGNFKGNYPTAYLHHFITIEKNVSRFVFLNEQSKISYSKIVTDLAKEFKKKKEGKIYKFKNKKILKFFKVYKKILKSIINLKTFTILKENLYKAVSYVLLLKRSHFWNIYKNYGDYRKLIVKEVQNVKEYLDSLIVKLYDEVCDIKETLEKIKLIKQLTKVELGGGQRYNIFNKNFLYYLASHSLVADFEIFLKLFGKYRKMKSLYKIGYFKKLSLRLTKKKKLIGKSKNGYKHLTKDDLEQFKGPYIRRKHYINGVDTYTEPLKYLENAGSFNLIEKKDILIKNGYKKRKKPISIFLKQNLSVEDYKTYFEHLEEKKYYQMFKNMFLYKGVKNPTLELLNSYKKLKKRKKNNDLKKKLKNFLKTNFKKKERILIFSKNFDLLKKEYIFNEKNFKNYLKKKEINSKEKIKNSILEIEQEFNFLKSLGKNARKKLIKKRLLKGLDFLNKKEKYKKRKKITDAFVSKSLKLRMKKKNLKKLFLEKQEKAFKKMPNIKLGEFFIYKKRPENFKGSFLKEFLKKKEKKAIDGNMLSSYFSFHGACAFDLKAVIAKIKKQEYSSEKTQLLIDQFRELSAKKYQMRTKKNKGIYKKEKEKMMDGDHEQFDDKTPHIFKTRYGIHLGKKLLKTKKKYLKPGMRKSILTQFRSLYFIRYSYARLFFIFGFISLRVERNIEPKEMFYDRHYGREHLYEFGSILFLYLLKKPFYDFFSYYISSIIKYGLGINIDYKYVIITNDDLSANFIANHIARALYYGLSGGEVVKPIRKDLNKLIARLRVLEQRSRNPYLASYNNGDNLNLNFSEYSFIYIKLHIKNYLLSSSFYFLFNKCKNLVNYSAFKYLKISRFLWKLELKERKGKNVFKKRKARLLIKKKRKKLYILSFLKFVKFFFKLKYNYYFFLLYKKKIQSFFFNYKLKNILPKKRLSYNLNYLGNIDKTVIFSKFNNFFVIFTALFNINKNFKERKKILRLDSVNRLKNNIYKKNGFLGNNKHEKIYNYFLKKKKYLKFRLKKEKKTKFFIKSKLFNTLLYKKKLKKKTRLELLGCKVGFCFCKTPVLVFFFNLSELIVILEELSGIINEKNSLNSFGLKYVNLILDIFSKFFKNFITFFYIYIKLLKLNSSHLNLNKGKSLVNLISILNSNFLIKKFFIFLTLIVKFVVLTFKLLNKKGFKYYLKKGIYKSKLFLKPNGGNYFFFKQLNKKLRNFGLKSQKINYHKFISIFYLKFIILTMKLLYFLKIYSKFHINLINKKKGYLQYFFCKNFYYYKYNYLLNKYLINNKFVEQFQKIFSQARKLFFLKFNKYNYSPQLNVSFLLDLKKFDGNVIKIVDKDIRKKSLSKYSAIIKKKTYVDYFYQNRFLLGYKLRFAGRFKTRRKRSIMGLKKGLNPITAHERGIDYGDYEISNEFSKYSVRIGLNKNKNIKHKHYLKF